MHLPFEPRALWTLSFLALKATAVMGLAAAIRERVGSASGSLALSWVYVQVGFIGVLLACSVFHAITGSALWIAAAGFAAGAWWLARRASAGLGSLFAPDPAEAGADPVLRNWINWQTALIASCIFLALVCRGMLLFDTTWDAMTYGLPRISYFASEHTLFSRSPTQYVSIFCNEWNGELLALLYIVATGWDQASSFGGVEIWLFALCSFSWLMKLIAPRRPEHSVAALAVATAPVILGLCMTVKGDIVSACAYMAGLAALLQLSQGKNQFFWGTSAAVALAYSAGAKVTTLPTVAVIAPLWILYTLWRRRFVLAGGAMLLMLIALSRFAINCVQFHNPIQRMPNEISSIGSSGFLVTAGWLFRKSFDISDSYLGQPWVLSLGFGATGLLACGSLLHLPFFRWPRNPAGNWRPVGLRTWLAGLVFILAAANFAFNLWCIPWRPWGFRYYVPWTGLLLTGALGLLIRTAPSSFRPMWTLLLLGMAAWNCAAALTNREVNAISWRAAYSSTQLQRKLAPWRNLPLAASGLQRLEPARVVVFNGVDALLYPFFGDDHRNRVLLTDSTEHFLQLVSRLKPDIAAVTARENTGDSFAQAAAGMAANRELMCIDEDPAYRYWVYANAGKWMSVFRGRAIFDGEGRAWLPWGAKADIDAASRRVASAEPVDAGLICPLTLGPGSYRLHAFFSGSVAGESNAANVSLHGVRRLISIPSGVYGANTHRQANFEIDPPGFNGYLLFGLGGWSTGKGEIQLSNVWIEKR